MVQRSQPIKRRSQSGRGSRVGDRIIEGLTELRDALRSGEPLERRFKVRHVRPLPAPNAYGPGQVRDTRDALGVSQAVFAQVLGVSTSLVQSWEQGFRKPSKMACRLLDEINRSREHWQRLVSAA
jgi:DNA-binding transcriptional regulator YiaG